MFSSIKKLKSNKVSLLKWWYIYIYIDLFFLQSYPECFVVVVILTISRRACHLCISVIKSFLVWYFNNKPDIFCTPFYIQISLICKIFWDNNLCTQLLSHLFGILTLCEAISRIIKRWGKGHVRKCFGHIFSR